MHQQFGRGLQPCASAAGDGFAEFHRVPVDDGGRQQVEAGHAAVLSFRRTVAQFALPMEVNGPFQGMMRLALVQSDACAPPQAGIHDPVDHDYGPFDAADLAKGRRQFILPEYEASFRRIRLGAIVPAVRSSRHPLPIRRSAGKPP